MKCPTCPDSTLVMSDRAGVEIDYCAACRGVWLDRGELDKIIDRVAAAEPPSAAPPSFPAPDSRRSDDDRRDDDRRYKPRDDDDRYESKPYGKKRKSLLGDLFDF